MDGCDSQSRSSTAYTRNGDGEELDSAKFSVHPIVIMFDISWQEY